MASAGKGPRAAETPAERFERVVKAVEGRQRRAKERRHRAEETGRNRLDKPVTATP